MKPVQEEDLLPGRAITLVGVSAIVIMLLLVFWAHQLLEARSARVRPEREYPERTLPSPSSASDIEQQPFALPAPGPDLVAASRERLNSYGWVDRSRRTVHVPIARAKELYLREGDGQ